MPLAGFLTGREQRSNADFRVVLGWFRVGKCRFTNVVHLPSKEHLFQLTFAEAAIVCDFTIILESMEVGVYCKVTVATTIEYLPTYLFRAVRFLNLRCR